MNETCDIVIGDRAVDETMKRMASLPLFSLKMFVNFLKQRMNNWEQTYGFDAKVISTAISGGETLKQQGLQLDMGRV